MLSNRQFAQKIENRRKSTVSVGIVFLMITSTWLGLISTVSQEFEVESQLVDADPLSMSEAQSTDQGGQGEWNGRCLLYTSPSPRDMRRSRMPSSA